MRMIQRLRQTASACPHPFRLLFCGTSINVSGTNLVWPLLTLYLRQQLGIPLTTVALLLTTNSVASRAVDRVGSSVAVLLSTTIRSCVMVPISAAYLSLQRAVAQGGSVRRHALARFHERWPRALSHQAARHASVHVPSRRREASPAIRR